MTDHLLKRNFEGSAGFLLSSLDGLAWTLSDALADYFRRARCRVTLLIDVPGAGPHLCGSRSLLRGSERSIRALADDWKRDPVGRVNHDKTRNIVSVSWHTSRLHTWFIETPATLCSTDVVGYWIFEAATRVDDEIESWARAVDRAQSEGVKTAAGEQYIGPSNYDSDRRVISGYGMEAATEYIREEYLRLRSKKGLDFSQYVAIPEFLSAVLRISTTVEEGAPARGRLCLYIGDAIDELPLRVRFESSQRPSLGRSKHVRKLLTAVAGQDAALVTDGDLLFGILAPIPSEILLVAHFNGRAGELLFCGSTMATFASGRYFGAHIAPDGTYLVDAVRRSTLPVDEEVLSHVTAIVQRAVQQQHGCTLVIDCRSVRSELSGHRLADPLPLDSSEHLSAACAMSHVDGALHLSGHGAVLAFGCLLDGMCHPEEDLARGARYNSALRFSAAHPGTGVVVSSEDGWLSIFIEGVDILDQDLGSAEFADDSALSPAPRLTEWLAASSLRHRS